MAVVRVVGSGGATSEMDVVNGTQLMEALRDANTAVQGTCGGMMSCGTCHVYVDTGWADRLPPKSEDEVALLEAIGEIVEVRPTSRLSCQIMINDDVAGLIVEVAPPV